MYHNYLHRLFATTSSLEQSGFCATKKELKQLLIHLGFLSLPDDHRFLQSLFIIYTIISSSSTLMTD